MSDSTFIYITLQSPLEQQTAQSLALFAPHTHSAHPPKTLLKEKTPTSSEHYFFLHQLLPHQHPQMPAFWSKTITPTNNHRMAPKDMSDGALVLQSTQQIVPLLLEQNPASASVRLLQSICPLAPLIPILSKTPTFQAHQIPPSVGGMPPNRYFLGSTLWDPQSLPETSTKEGCHSTVQSLLTLSEHNQSALFLPYLKQSLDAQRLHITIKADLLFLSSFLFLEQTLHFILTQCIHNERLTFDTQQIRTHSTLLPLLEDLLHRYDVH